MSGRKITEIIFQAIAVCGLVYMILGFFGIVPLNDTSQAIILTLCIALAIGWRILDKKKAD